MKTYKIRNCKYQYFELWQDDDGTITKTFSGFHDHDLNPKTQLAYQCQRRLKMAKNNNQ